ncbi:MAG TPA: aminotransferase, partial [Gammaproteobacteria bacterium]|nr:aminotransferase [Gammaproteobacteria bacterium]
MDKRAFIKNLGVMGAGLSGGFTSLREAVAAVEHVSPADLATDEDFWLKVRGDYEIKPDYINLENGYYCFLPQQTLEHLIDHMRMANREGSYYMRTVQFENKNRVANAVAEIVGCSSGEVAITRNTTESL